MAYNSETGMYEGYIYCIENLINGKKYIGQTIKTIEQRWKQHITTSRNPNADKYPVHLAINKYGEKCFNVYLIDKYSYDTLEKLKEKLNIQEIFYIEQNKTRDKEFGYNLAIGGSIIQYPYRKVKQFTMDGQLVKHWNSIKEACDFYHIQCGNIVGCCTGLQKTSAGFVWRYDNDEFDKFNCKNHNVKRIIKYSVSGEYIDEYHSITEAAKINNANITHIHKCCIGKNKTCKGFVYRYAEDDFNKYDIQNKTKNKDYRWATSKKVNCYTLNDEFVKTYDSLHLAQIDVGLKSSSSITASCKGKIKFSAGFKWFYADDLNQPDKTKIIKNS